jgi:CHAT domain-containing protein
LQLDARIREAKGAAQVSALYWRGQAHGELGFRSRAVDDLELALRESRSAAADPATLATITGALGIQLLRSGDAPGARSQLELALRLSSGSPAHEASALADLGDLLLREDRATEAADAWRRALDQGKTAGASAVVARTASNLLRENMSSSEARALAQTAASALHALPDSHDKAYGLIALAQIVDSRRGRLHEVMLLEARNWLQQALSIGTSIGDLRSVSHASGQLGRLDEEAGKHEDALVHSRRAVLAAQEAGAAESLYRWQWQAARLLARLGQAEDALATYRRAFGSLHGIRQDLISELRASRQSYREAIGPLYTEYADLLLRRARPLSGRPEAQRDLLEARDAIEGLKAVELEDYFQDECVAGQQARQKELDKLAPRTAVLYPVILPGRMELLLSLPSGMRQVVVQVTAQELAAESLALRQLLEKRSTHEYMPHSRRLYDLLIRPMQEAMAAEAVDTLVLVPDGPLRSIPLSALHDGKQFLVERFAVATAPGLRLIEPQALVRQTARVLLNGLTLSVQQFPPLPHVASEMKSIGELMRARVLADRDFVTRSFEQALRDVPYSVVHIASHGQFDSDPKKSFLLTFDGKLDMDGLERVMKLSRFREEPVELLTLSACRTAAGDDRAALGLAGIAIKAGARSALATLWYINDEASSVLVTEFYRGLSKPAYSKARALQEAQQSLLRDGRYRHPGYWSPFLLIGNWL